MDIAGSVRKLFAVFMFLTLTACGGGGGGGGGVEGAPTTSQMGGARQGIALNLTGVTTTLAGVRYGQDGTGVAADLGYPTNAVTVGNYLYVLDSGNNAIRKIEISTGTTTTLAGGNWGYQDGTGTEASFNNPEGITTDGSNLYVADTSSHTIRKIEISTAIVTTLAGTAYTRGSADGIGAAASFNYPTSIQADLAGENLYVSDSRNNTIRRIVIATGAVTTFAGAPTVTDGIGTAARFNLPSKAVSDGTNLYVTDTYNHAIRRIVISTGAVTTLAGSPGYFGSNDGTGSAARFSYPNGITSDGTNLYVADTYNNTIRRIVISTGVVSTLAGTAGSAGSSDGTGAAARFYHPQGINRNGAYLYVADTTNNTIRRIVISTGVVTTLAGTAGLTGYTNGTGVDARFNAPQGITSDSTYLYVADTYNLSIRRIVISTGVVTSMLTIGAYDVTTDGTNLYLTSASNVYRAVIANSAMSILAGSSTTGSTDGTGTAASFNIPRGIAISGTNLFITDTYNNSLRRVVISSGAVTTLAGSPPGADGTGNTANFISPSQITTDGTNLYLADGNTIRKIVISTAAVTTLAGSANSGVTDGTGTAALFDWPQGITNDGTNLYVADTYNQTIRRLEISSRIVTTLAGTVETRGYVNGTGTTVKFNYPMGMTSDGTHLYLADSENNTLRKIVINTGAVTTLAGAPAGADGTGEAARFSYPRGITSDGTHLFVADTYNHVIRQTVISTGAVTTLAGKTGSSYSVDGTGADASFNSPDGITTDGTHLYVTDNHAIRKIVISTGVVTTLAGTAGSTGSTDGTGAEGRFNNPRDLTTNGTDLYVTDTNNHTIRKIVISTGVVTTLAGTAGSYGYVEGTGMAALMNSPQGITTTGGHLYVSDGNNVIRKIVISTGAVTTLAGSLSGDEDGTGIAARFRNPGGLTTDGTHLYVTDTDNHTVRKIVINTGVVTTVAGVAANSGSNNGTATTARFEYPQGITTDGSRLFIADSGNAMIRVIQ